MSCHLQLAGAQLDPVVGGAHPQGRLTESDRLLERGRGHLLPARIPAPWLVAVWREGGVLETPDGITCQLAIRRRSWRRGEIERFTHVGSRVYVVSRHDTTAQLFGWPRDGESASGRSRRTPACMKKAPHAGLLQCAREDSNLHGPFSPQYPVRRCFQERPIVQIARFRGRIGFSWTGWMLSPVLSRRAPSALRRRAPGFRLSVQSRLVKPFWV